MDLLWNRVKLLDSGQISTVAGTGKGMVNGMLAHAEFNRPNGIAVDKRGRIYVADRDNHCIRLITLK